MPKLDVLRRTLTVTRNPFVVLSLKRGNSRKTVVFRNGWTFRLTWPQFRSLRDSYHFFTNCSVTQLQDDLFNLDDNKSKVVCNANHMPLFCEIMTDFTIQQEKDNLFHLKNEKLELLGSTGMLVCIQEQRTGEYEYDYNGKVVLDIGGFEGESAAYFWVKGAKKVIIYEPVPVHIEFIKKNVLLNHIDAEVHNYGIGVCDGTQVIHYDETDPGFGLHSKGKNSTEIKVADVSKVLAESGADIAKLDCEGAEECLVNVSTQILQKIEYYIIEVHSDKIRAELLEKFRNSGFILTKEMTKPTHPQFSIIGFQRIVLK